MAELVENLPATYPPDQYASLHAEIATGVYRSKELVKIYFATMEGDVFGRPMGPAKANPIGQVSMPTDGFIGMVVFLQSYLKDMVKAGVITEEDIQEKRNAFPNLREA